MQPKYLNAYTTYTDSFNTHTHLKRFPFRMYLYVVYLRSRLQHGYTNAKQQPSLEYLPIFMRIRTVYAFALNRSCSSAAFGIGMQVLIVFFGFIRRRFFSRSIVLSFRYS